MKRIVFLLAVVFAIYACNHDARDSKNTKTLLSAEMVNNPAQIKFDSLVHDFKKIPEGDKVVYNFRFTNTSKNPLVITEVQASCGCTTPEWPHEIIKPGESNFIKVQYNSEGHEGQFNKGITVTTNTIPNRTVLIIKGQVI